MPATTGHGSWMTRLLPFLFLLLSSACADVLFSPSEEELHIELERAAIDEASLLVGERLALSVKSSRGANPPAAWRSDDPQVATVNQHGEVLGVAPGNTRVIASMGQFADTIFVSVLAALPAAAQCAEGGLTLQRGEAITTTAAAAADLCIVGGERNQIYILVPFHAARTGGTLRVEIEAEGVGNGMITREPQGPALGMVEHGAAEASSGPSRDWRFDRLLRERERSELTPLLGAGTGLRTSPSTNFATIPAVGDTLTLNVNPNRTCTDPAYRKARVAAISGRAIVVHDVLNPPGGFTADEYGAFAKQFDESIYPNVTGHFGEPTDIDGNQRILLLFTSAVNQMTAQKAGAYVAGFFYARDLFPRTDTAPLAGCDASNQAELIYMMTPDPSGVINRNIRSKTFVAERTPAVLAHELQHLINASRRLRVVRTDHWSEEFWLNEGLSHIAEEVMFYSRSSFEPRQEVSGVQVRSRSGALAEYGSFMSVNMTRYGTFLRDPAAATPLTGEDLATRGASWSFLRYTADRLHGDDVAFWNKLVDSETVGYANLAKAIGASPLSWMHDWAVSFYTDDFIDSVDARFRQPSWNFRSVIPTLTTMSSYPLAIHQINDLETGYTGDLAVGGSAVLRFSVPAEGRARIRTTSGDVAPPKELRLTLVRTW